MWKMKDLSAVCFFMSPKWCHRITADSSLCRWIGEALEVDLSGLLAVVTSGFLVLELQILMSGFLEPRAATRVTFFFSFSARSQ